MTVSLLSLSQTEIDAALNIQSSQALLCSSRKVTVTIQNIPLTTRKRYLKRPVPATWLQ